MPSSVDLVCVDPARIAEVWPHCAHLIRVAIEATGLSEFADIEADVLAGRQLLWLAWNGQSIEAAATTHLVKIEGRKVCILTALSGYQRERWLSLLDRLEAYAKAEGCALMRIFGRKGWHRVLPEYRVEHVVLEKGLI
jgi:hypothetical protein